MEYGIEYSRGGKTKKVEIDNELNDERNWKNTKMMEGTNIKK